MTIQTVPTDTAAFEDLPAHERAAIRFAWRGWAGDAGFLACLWPRVPEFDELPNGAEPTDWWRLKCAAEVSRSRTARWPWQDAASELIIMLTQGREHSIASVQGGDALNMLTDERAVMASALACRTAVCTVGKPAARTLCRMVYEGCRPSPALMWDSLDSVPCVEFGGRVYVL